MSRTVEMLGLTDRLSLVEGNVLVDAVSGRRLVLNATGVAFFEIYRRLGDGAEAVRAAVTRFGLAVERARDEYGRFLAMVDQGQRCEGSLLPGARHAVLEPTSACNGQCPHCYHGEHSSRWLREEHAAIVERLSVAGVRSVSLTGGEVFSAHFTDQFFDLVAELARHGIAVASVSTNATFLTEEVRDRILGVFSPSTVFRISLDALRGDLLDRVRPGYRALADPYAPIRDLDAAGFPLVFTTNVFHAHGAEDVREIGGYLRGYTQVRAWNVRMAVPVHHGAGELTRTAARRRQLFGTRPKPTLPLRSYHALLADHAAVPFPFEVRMGNYLATSLLRHPHALIAFPDGHPCREDARLVTVKADGRVTQCPILTELDPALAMGPVLGDRTTTGLSAGFEENLPLAGLHTGRMPCHTCALRPVCGGGCRLYALAYDEGVAGCDLPAKALLAWLLLDPTGVLRRRWPAYHQRLRSLVSLDEAAVELCEAAIAGWDA